MTQTETFKVGQRVCIAEGHRNDPAQGPSGIVTIPQDEDGLVWVKWGVLGNRVLKFRPSELEGCSR